MGLRSQSEHPLLGLVDMGADHFDRRMRHVA
jgi:hypothetical protein